MQGEVGYLPPLECPSITVNEITLDFFPPNTLFGTVIFLSHRPQGLKALDHSFISLLLHFSHSSAPQMFSVWWLQAQCLCVHRYLLQPISRSKHQVLNVCWNMICVGLYLNPCSQCHAHNWCSGIIYWIDIKISRCSLSCWRSFCGLVGRQKLSWDPGSVRIPGMSLKLTSSWGRGRGGVRSRDPAQTFSVLLKNPNLGVWKDSWTAMRF